MNILFITEKWYPQGSGGEIYFNNLANKLVNRGHNIFIITGKPIRNLNKKFKILASLPIYYNQQNLSFSTILKRILYDLILFTIIYKIKKEKIDIIHTIPPICSVVSQLFHNILKIPIVISILSFGYDNWFKITESSLKDTFFKKIQAFAWRLKYNKIFTISNKFFEIAKKLRLNREIIQFIPNAVDRKYFYPKKKSLIHKKIGFKETDFIVAYFGSLEKNKRVDILINSMVQLSTQKRIKLLIVGNGTEEKKLKKMKNILRLENIIFFNKVPYHLMPKYLSIIDLLALPSVSEGFPGIILESLACGKPVITTRVGELKYILEHEKNGYFISEIDLVNEMSDAILKLYNNKELYGKLSRNGLELVEKYSWDTISKRIEENYGEILSRNFKK